jgi:hypothetical protein
MLIEESALKALKPSPWLKRNEASPKMDEIQYVVQGLWVENMQFLFITINLWIQFSLTY